MKHVFLRIDRMTAQEEAEALRMVLDAAAHCREPAWVILQSYGAPEVKWWKPGDSELAAAFGAVFNGRIFGEQGEVRWIREGSHWEIWCLREAESGSGPFVAEGRRYYLWGIYKTDPESGQKPVCGRPHTGCSAGIPDPQRAEKGRPGLRRSMRI